MNNFVKIRLSGLPADVQIVADDIRQTMMVYEESADYQNHNSQFVRRYLTVLPIGEAARAASEDK